MSAKRLKDTKLGAWLREKAPQVLDKVGDVLPDEGALGIVKNLIDSDKQDPAFDAAMIDAELRAQENVTRRWEADMNSDERLAKMIRPITLIVLLSLYLFLVGTSRSRSSTSTYSKYSRSPHSVRTLRGVAWKRQRNNCGWLWGLCYLSRVTGPANPKQEQ